MVNLFATKPNGFIHSVLERAHLVFTHNLAAKLQRILIHSFQIPGPTTWKARLATDDSLTGGTTRRLVSAEIDGQAGQQRDWVDRGIASHQLLVPSLRVLRSSVLSILRRGAHCRDIYMILSTLPPSLDVSLRYLKVKAVYSASWETHLRATGRHLPYGITQCYLSPDTSEHAPP